MSFLNLSLGELLGLAGALSAAVVALYLLDRSKRKQVVPTLRFWAGAGVRTTVVPEEVATQWRACMRDAKAVSNSFTREAPPEVRPHLPLRKTARSAASSRWSESGQSDAAFAAGGRTTVGSAAEDGEIPKARPAPAALPRNVRRVRERGMADGVGLWGGPEGEPRGFTSAGS